MKLKALPKYWAVFALGIMVGFVCSYLVHDPIKRRLHAAFGFGVVDLSGQWPEKLTEDLPLLPVDENMRNTPGALPAGSILYPHKGYSEGFTTYIVYINVAASSLKSTPVKFEHNNTIAPVWGESEDQPDAVGHD